MAFAALTESARRPLRLPGLVCLALGVALAGCESSPTLTAPGTPEPLLQTGSLEYTLEPTSGEVHEVVIPYSFTNRTGSAVSIRNCDGVFSLGLERKTTAGWVRSWSSTLVLCVSAPIVIAPGEAYHDFVTVQAAPPTAYSGMELPLESAPGTYRIVWDRPLVGYDDGAPDSGSILSKEQRVSNAFTMELP
ncbi:MAG TPA: hypothetical protein VK858_22120 [Longimicrobiales bacterium]|nr:hypothetical protein [Longimicrobiales bacterium]